MAPLRRSPGDGFRRAATTVHISVSGAITDKDLVSRDMHGDAATASSSGSKPRCCFLHRFTTLDLRKRDGAGSALYPGSGGYLALGR